MRLVLDNDWFTPAPGGVVYYLRLDKGGTYRLILYGFGIGGRGGRLTRSIILACRRREGITAPVWVIDGEMGRDELQTGKKDDGNGQHDGRWVMGNG